MSRAAPSDNRARRPWRLAALWLVFLGPFFFLAYGFANNRAASAVGVGTIVFDWEREYIPFVPFMLLPYMSIDAFYAAALFVAKTRAELHRLAHQLLLATLVSVGCFLAFPLRITFEKPPVSGFNGVLLEMLTSFDKPFNAAPSLHISLLIILWAHYARHLSGLGRSVLNVWFALIGVSVLFTWQHHFFDVPTGALVGFAVLYLLPEQAGAWRWCGSTARGRCIALSYAGAAAACVAIATPGGAALWLLWPAVSFSIVTVAYLGAGPAAFQKRADGRRTLAASALLWPYLALARVNSELWAWIRPRLRERSDIGDLVLRRHPGQRLPDVPLLDVSAEFATVPVQAVRYRSVPMLDLAAPAPSEVEEAVQSIDSLLPHGKVHVCCALGLGRSAAVVAAWLLHAGESHSVAEAAALVQARRPGAVFPAEILATLETWWQGRNVAR